MSYVTPMSSTCYAILIALQDEEKTAVLKSASVQNILEMDGVAGTSPAAVYKAIDMLLGRSFIARGVKIGNSNTYYITKQGIQHVTDAIE